LIKTIDGMLVRNGNLVRSGIARKSTILRALHKVPDDALDEYMVIWYENHRPARQSAREFMATCLKVWRE
jgi:hypothetical protein